MARVLTLDKVLELADDYASGPPRKVYVERFGCGKELRMMFECQLMPDPDSCFYVIGITTNTYEYRIHASIFEYDREWRVWDECPSREDRLEANRRRAKYGCSSYDAGD